MLAIDQNITNSQTSNTGTVSSPALTTTTGNQLLLAFICADTSATINTPTGGGLTWVRCVRANGHTSICCDIWSAYSNAILTNVTTTATSTNATSDMFINIVTITGADPTGTNGSGAIGATNTASSSLAAITTSVTTTRANSWVFAVAADTTTNAGSFTWGAGQVSMAFKADGTDIVSYASARRILLTNPQDTSVTMNISTPADSLNLGVVEILPIQGAFQLPNKGLRPHPFSPGLSR